MKMRDKARGMITVCIPMLIAWLGCVSCISDYEPKGIDMIRDLLVVDGIITNGETKINLRKSIGLTDKFNKDEFVNDAKVTVERQDGVQYVGTLFSDKGDYRITTGELDMEQPYRLRVLVGGLEYESDYVIPVATPPIDNVKFQQAGRGEEVHLCVSTHNDQEGSKYYRWIYKENWEIKAEMFMVAEYTTDEGVLKYDLVSSNNAYYCWSKDSTKAILLGTSDKLTENVISNKRLLTISPDNQRLSIMYHVEVEQYALHREAYDYYFNLQKNVEEPGSLFAPIPSELKGNIRCVSNPEIPVIGYVEVSTVTRDKRFLPEIKDMYEPLRSGCSYSLEYGAEHSKDPGYGFLTYSPEMPADHVLAPRRCVDCRLSGTKNKPSWWPNDHL